MQLGAAAEGLELGVGNDREERGPTSTGDQLGRLLGGHRGDVADRDRADPSLERRVLIVGMVATLRRVVSASTRDLDLEHPCLDLPKHSSCPTEVYIPGLTVTLVL